MSKIKLFTAGPVEMYPETLRVASKQIPYFRTKEFSACMLGIDQKLKKLIYAQPEDQSIYLAATGTAAMEASVMNCFNQKDKLLIISGGTFGERFVKICEIHNIPFDVLKLEFGEVLTENKLEIFRKKKYTGMLVNIHETTTGQLYPVQLLSEFCIEKNMYFVVDAVSSIFADEFHMTKYKIDVTIFSSQKALALSPGLAVVVLSERIYQERVKENKIASLYFDFNEYILNMKRGQTPFTPTIGILVELENQLQRIEKLGIDEVINQTKILALYFRKQAIEGGFKIPSYPLSNAITPLLVENNAYTIFEELLEKNHIYVNPCGGAQRNTMLRIGHMGNLKKKDYDNLLQAIKEIQ